MHRNINQLNRMNEWFVNISISIWLYIYEYQILNPLDIHRFGYEIIDYNGL